LAGVADQIDVPLEVVAGLCTQISPADLPLGVSPDCQDIQFQQGDARTRPGVTAQYTLVGNPTVNYLKTYLNQIEVPRLLSLDSNGVLRKDPTPGGSPLTVISSAILPNLFAKSATAFSREYIALSNGTIGADIPRQYNDTWLDRISQVGPGLAPVAQDENVSNTIAASPAGAQMLGASNIISASEVGGLVTIVFSWGSTNPLQINEGDPFIVSGIATAGYNGTFTAAAAILAKNGIANQLTYFNPTSGLAPDNGGGSLQMSYAVIQFTGIQTAANSIPAGASVLIAGVSNADYNGTWRVAYATSPGGTPEIVIAFGQTGVAPSGTGTGATAGNISAGIHQLSCIFVTRNGYYTKPAPPGQWTAGGAHRVVVSQIPIGPPNVIARIVCFTAAAGASFYHLGPFDIIIFSSNMYIGDNTTTTQTFDFTDGDLQLGTLDDPLFNLIELPEVAGVTSYAERTFAWGERNMLTGFLNLPMDGGFTNMSPITPPNYPLGWLLDKINSAGGGSAVAAGNPPFFGDAYTITGDGVTAIRGKIAQTAYQDYLLNGLLQPNTAYTIRARIQAVGATAGTIHVNLQSTLGGYTTVGISQAWNTLTGSYGVYEGNLTPGLPTIPTDLQLQVYVDGTANAGAVFSIKILGIYPTDIPWNGSNVRGSGTGDDVNQTPESFDSQTGLITISENNGQSIRSLFQVRERLYAVKEDSFFATQDDGVNEPSGWSVQPVSDRVGTPSINGVGGGYNQASGEDWVVIAHRTGLFIFYGGEPSKICPEIQPLWDTINWEFGTTVSVAIDTRLRRIFVCAPFGDSEIPNQALVLDYHDVGGPEQIASMEPVKLSYTGRKIVSDKARKWCPWTIPANIVQPIETADGTTQIYFGSNDGTGNINELDDTGTVFTDNGATIPSYYTTAAFPELSSEQPLQLRSHRKLFAYLTLYAQGGVGSPQQTLADDPFNRANEDPYVSPNWALAPYTDNEPFAILGGRAVASAASVGQDFCQEYWNGSNTWGPNVFAQVEVDALKQDADSEVDIIVRGDFADAPGGNGDGYHFAMTNDLATPFNKGAGVYFSAVAFTAGNQNGVILPGQHPIYGVGPFEFVPGAIMSVEFNDSAFTLKYNGQVILSGQDNTISVSGYVQMVLFAGAAQTDVQVSNFQAGTLSASSGTALLGVTVFPSSLSNAIVLNPLPLSDPCFEDLEMMTNFEIERAFYKFSTSGNGQWMSLQRVCPSLKQSSWSNVRGGN
jgi:hypothetical protein